MPWAKLVVIGLGLLLLGLVVFVRSLGQWTEELIAVHANQKLILKSLRVFQERRASIKDAKSHVAPFCYEDEYPELPDEDKTA